MLTAPLSAALLISLALTASAAAPVNRAQPWRDTVRAFAQQHFKNPAWGYSHCERDYALAKQLASADGKTLDDDVLFAAAYLHDIAAFKPWRDDSRDHSDVSAAVIDGVLAETDFPQAKLDAVKAAIRTHMFYRDPAALEAVYLHDADALDWLGDIGIARLFGNVDPNGGHPTGPEAVAMIKDFATKVPARVISPAGRRLVPQRLAETNAFLDRLSGESESFRTL